MLQAPAEGAGRLPREIGLSVAPGGGGGQKVQGEGWRLKEKCQHVALQCPTPHIPALQVGGLTTHIVRYASSIQPPTKKRCSGAFLCAHEGARHLSPRPRDPLLQFLAGPH